MGNFISSDLSQERYLCQLVLKEDCTKFLSFLHIAAANGHIQQADCSFGKLISKLAKNIVDFREKLSDKSNNVEEISSELECLDKYSNWHKFCIREIQRILENLPFEFEMIVEQAFEEGNRAIDTLALSSFRFSENIESTRNRDSLALYACKDHADQLVDNFSHNILDVNGCNVEDSALYKDALRTILYTIAIDFLRSFVNRKLKGLVHDGVAAMYFSINAYVENTVTNPSTDASESYQAISELLNAIYGIESQCATDIYAFLGSLSPDAVEPAVFTSECLVDISTDAVSSEVKPSKSKYIRKLVLSTDKVFQQILFMAKSELNSFIGLTTGNSKQNLERIRRLLLSRSNARAMLRLVGSGDTFQSADCLLMDEGKDNTLMSKYLTVGSGREKEILENEEDNEEGLTVTNALPSRKRKASSVSTSLLAESGDGQEEWDTVSSTPSSMIPAKRARNKDNLRTPEVSSTPMSSNNGVSARASNMKKQPSVVI
jgi:hypothetical protein